MAAYRARHREGQAADLARALSSPESFIDAAGARWLESVEALRGELAADLTPLEVLDFGAGIPGDPRSEQEMHQGVITTEPVRDLHVRASSGHRKGARLFAVTRAVKPQVVLELGTNLGVSAACIAAAMEVDGGPGRLYTIEGAPAVADRASLAVKSAGLGDRTEVLTGRFVDVLPDLLASSGTIDLAFIDGHHDGDATLDYYRTIREHSRPGAVLAFDDIKWSPSMRNAWSTISKDAAVKSAVAYGGIGFAVLA